MSKVFVINKGARVLNIPALPRTVEDLTDWRERGVIDDAQFADLKRKPFPAKALSPGERAELTEAQFAAYAGAFASVEIYQKAGEIDFTEVSE